MSVDIEKSESITRDILTPKELARARVKLAMEYQKNGDNEKAKKTYLEVERNDDDVSFAYSKFNLGVILRDEGDYYEAIKSFEEINESDGKLIYYRAQFCLGIIFRDYLNDKDKSKECFLKSENYFYYNSNKEMLFLLYPELTEIIDSIFSSVRHILSILRVGNDIHEHEKCVAHYTSPSVAFSLLAKDSSRLRLNTVKNVNDPTEGKILKKYLKIPESLDSRYKSGVFLSCFTFNHDSLNQFRLYGKENNLEASGVSIVFNNDFFDDQTVYINFIEGIQKPVEKDDKFIGKLNLYRCIYIDPESDYVNIAHRSRITFYKDKKKNEISDYLSTIETKKNGVVKELNSILKKIKELSRKKTKNKDSIIEFLLLPINFLVKHAAFEDEQECRMLYLTDLHNEKITTCENRFMYLNYKPEVKKYVHKIYLSSGAYKYEDFFIRLLDGEDKVRLSTNPFRNKP